MISLQYIGTSAAKNQHWEMILHPAMYFPNCEMFHDKAQRLISLHVTMNCSFHKKIDRPTNYEWLKRRVCLEELYAVDQM